MELTCSYVQHALGKFLYVCVYMRQKCVWYIFSYFKNPIVDTILINFNFCFVVLLLCFNKCDSWSEKTPLSVNKILHWIGFFLFLNLLTGLKRSFRSEKQINCPSVVNAERNDDLIKPPAITSNSSPLDKMAAIFSDDIFKCIFLNEKFCISIRISLKFVLSSLINNTSALVQVMAWRRTGGKPLPEPMLTQFTDAYMRHQGESSSDELNGITASFPYHGVILFK